MSPFTYNITFAPGVAGNPLGQDARFTGNRYSLGTRDQKTTSDTVRGLAGAKYGVATWDFDSGVGYSKNKIDQDNLRRLGIVQTSAVFNVPSTPQPPVPVSNASTCNLDMPYSSAGCSAMLVDVKRTATSEMTFVDTKATTELGQLPGGAAGLALGIEYRTEKINDRPDPIASSGGVLGQGITATDGSRHNTAGFVEFALPLSQAIEAQVAARDDHYSDFGNAFTPKFGLKIKPSNEVLLRANWGRGFRAPSLPEISPSVATFFVQVNDDLTGVSTQQISCLRRQPQPAPGAFPFGQRGPRHRADHRLQRQCRLLRHRVDRYRGLGQLPVDRRRRRAGSPFCFCLPAAAAFRPAPIGLMRPRSGSRPQPPQSLLALASSPRARASRAGPDRRRRRFP